MSLSLFPHMQKVYTWNLAFKIDFCRFVYSSFCISLFFPFILFRRETSPFGMKVSIVEPGAFSTGILQFTLESFQTSWNKAPTEAKEVYGQLYFDNCELKFGQLGSRLHIYLVAGGCNKNAEPTTVQKTMEDLKNIYSIKLVKKLIICLK